MTENNNIDVKELPDSVHDALVQIKEHQIKIKTAELEAIKSRNIQSILAHGISIREANFELAGRLAKKGWSSLRRLTDKTTGEINWFATDLLLHHQYTVDIKDIVDMLTAK